MKRFSSFIIFLLPLLLHAQDQDIIDLFAEEKTEWSIGVFYSNPYSPHHMVYLRMQGTASINDTLYHRILEIDGIGGDSTGVTGFIRMSQDSILFYRDTMNHEAVVFDFTLKEQDSTVLNLVVNGEVWQNEFAEFTAFCTDTSYIQTESGPRLCWSLGYEEQTGTEFWIQGIGPNSGIHSMHIPLSGLVGMTSLLLCAWHEGELIYDNPDYAFCEYTSVSDQKNIKPKVFPNPCADVLELEFFSDYKKRDMQLMDINGRVLREIQISEAKNTLDLSDLVPGCYFIKIEGFSMLKIMHY